MGTAVDPQLYAMAFLFFTIAGGGGAVVWRLTRVETSIREKISSETESLNARLSAIERDQLEEIGVVRHETGEGLAAVRTKIHEIETWSRDQFVRKDSFELVVGRLEKGIDALGDKIERHLDKMTERIEKLSSREREN